MTPLWLTAVASATDSAIQKKTNGSDHLLDLSNLTTTLIISNKEMKDITKTVMSLEDSGLLIEGITETIEN